MRRIAKSEDSSTEQDVAIIEKFESLFHALWVAEEESRSTDDAFYKESGFQIKRKKSLIKDAGSGVFVTEGCISEGTIAAMYPGRMICVVTICSLQLHLPQTSFAPPQPKWWPKAFSTKGFLCQVFWMEMIVNLFMVYSKVNESYFVGFFDKDLRTTLKKILASINGGVWAIAKKRIDGFLTAITKDIHLSG